MINKKYTIPDPKTITAEDFQEHHNWLMHNFEQDSDDPHIFHLKQKIDVTYESLEKMQ